MLVSTLNTHKTKNTVSFLLTATKNMHVEKANELLCPPAISNTLHNPSINDAMIASTRQILHCTKAKYFKINFCSEPSSEKEWMAWCTECAYLCRRARSNLFTMWKWENIDPNGRTRSRVYRIRWYTTFSRIRANAILKKNRTKQRSELTIYAERSNFVFCCCCCILFHFRESAASVGINSDFFQFIKYAAHFGDIARSFILLLFFFFVVASLIWTHFRLFGTGVVDGWLGWFGWSPMQIYTWQIKGLCCPHSLLQRAKSTFSFLF